MSSAPIGARRRGAHTSHSPTIPSHPSSDLQAARAKAAGEIASLVKLAELDAERLDREGERHAPPNDAVAHERHRLTAKLSSEILDAYNRSLRAGRRPAVVRLAANVCTGCNVRLHSTLEQKVRKRLGVGSCPHCLRLVYDPAWLHTDDAL
jgi:predicted  nucleic acid-binding Zn-ribbon protein